MTRLFVAVELPETVRERPAALKAVFPDLKWTAVENLHLTLRFIGEVSETEVETVRRVLRSVKAAPFVVRINGLGLFERKTQNILWAGLESSSALFSLKKIVDAALAEHAGLPAPGGSFQPHVTLSRLRRPVSAGLRKQVEIQSSNVHDEFTVTSFSLFKSLLTPSGSRHTRIELYPLENPQ